MASKSKAAGPANKGLRVTSRNEQGFRRCGRSFGPDGTTIALAELSEDEVDTLKGERQLIVTDVDVDTEKPAK